MKYLLGLLVIFAIALGVGLALTQQPGMIILVIGGWRIDIPLWLGILGLLLVIGLFHLVFALCAGLSRLFDMHLWKRIRQNMKNAAIVRAKALCAQHSPKAEKALRKILQSTWNEELVRLYGQLSPLKLHKAVSVAEKWLKKHPESPGLLFALGCLYEQQERWGKAERYFQDSLRLAPHPQTYAALAMLLEKMNKPVSADYFKKGLLSAVSHE